MANEESVDARTAEELLRRFEPVIRFTKGEWFYPVDCEPYAEACSLWVKRPGEDAGLRGSGRGAYPGEARPAA